MTRSATSSGSASTPGCRRRWRPCACPPRAPRRRALREPRASCSPTRRADAAVGRRPTPAWPGSATVGRAGYCFHQNAALGAGLEALGFDVTRRHGHVWTLPEHRDGAELNHLVLVVSGLPTDDNPGGHWWPDAGLGEGFRDPVGAGRRAVRGRWLRVRRGAREPGRLVLRQRAGRHVHRHRGDDPPGRTERHRGGARASCRLRRTATSPGSWSSSVARTRTTTRCAAASSAASSADHRDEPTSRRTTTGGPPWSRSCGCRSTTSRTTTSRALWSSVRGAHEAWDAAGRP